MSENYRALIKRARKQGWSVTKRGSGHLQFKSPTGETVTTAHTPSDKRALANNLSRLRKAGLKDG